MIEKTKLIGKTVEYLDKKGRFRSSTVLRQSSNTLTVGMKLTVHGKRKVLHKKRIHPDKDKIFGVYFRNKLVEIDWGRSA